MFGFLDDFFAPPVFPELSRLLPPPDLESDDFFAAFLGDPRPSDFFCATTPLLKRQMCGD